MTTPSSDSATPDECVPGASPSASPGGSGARRDQCVPPSPSPTGDALLEHPAASASRECVPNGTDQTPNDPNDLPVGTVLEVRHTDGQWALMFHQPDGRWSCALGPRAHTHLLAPDEVWRWPDEPDRSRDASRGGAVERVQARIDNLLAEADRWDAEGGSWRPRAGSVEDDLRSRLGCVLEATYWDRPYDERIFAIRGMCDLSTNGMAPEMCDGSCGDDGPHGLHFEPLGGA